MTGVEQIKHDKSKEVAMLQTTVHYHRTSGIGIATVKHNQFSIISNLISQERFDQIRVFGLNPISHIPTPSTDI
jgi:hypothetical protein